MQTSEEDRRVGVWRWLWWRWRPPVDRREQRLQLRRWRQHQQGAGRVPAARWWRRWSRSGRRDYVEERRPSRITYGAIGRGGGIDADHRPHGRLRRQRRAADAAIRRQPARAACRFRGRLARRSLTYNVKGVPDNLKLTGPVLADIYLGNITSWNDPAIAKLNPGVSLPCTHITPIYRSDGSGDSFVLTELPVRRQPGLGEQGRRVHPAHLPHRHRRRAELGSGRRVQATDGAIGVQWRSRTSPPTPERCADRRTRPATTRAPTEKAILAAAAVGTTTSGRHDAAGQPAGIGFRRLSRCPRTHT